MVFKVKGNTKVNANLLKTHQIDAYTCLHKLPGAAVKQRKGHSLFILLGFSEHKTASIIPANSDAIVY